MNKNSLRTFLLANALFFLATNPASSDGIVGFPDSLQLTDLTGRNGFAIRGLEAHDGFGSSVSSAGDLNGDGVNDLLIGAPARGAGTGSVYVVFGRSHRFHVTVDLSELDGTNGFEVRGRQTGDSFGASVASCGDVNGDGIDDVLIGAPLADPRGRDSGEAYVLYGRRTAFPSFFSVARLDGTDGFRITGVLPGDSFGTSVAGPGDMNGDGLDDLAISAPYADPDGANAAGEVYVIFGQSGGFPDTFIPLNLGEPNGFRITGNTEFLAGAAIANGGDFNGDGLGDLIVGIPGLVGQFGRVAVFLGRSTGFSDVEFLPHQGDRKATHILPAIEGGPLGHHFASAGDVNGDGFDDVIVGETSASPSGRPRAGASYVIYGGDDLFPIPVDILNGPDGFAIQGAEAGDESGWSVSGLGDIDGDGLDDVVVGACSADRNGRIDSGACSVVFGRPTGGPASLDLATLGGGRGFSVDGVRGDNRLGWSVAGVGDVNGDGVGDMLLGSNRSFSGDGEGEIYVVFGGWDSGAGTVNAAHGDSADVLLVQGSTGETERTVVASPDDLIYATVLKPPTGGGGRFLLHASLGCPEEASRTVLPYAIGTTPFPILLAQGAKPAIIANAVGRPDLAGESRFFGAAMEDPQPAPTYLQFPNLPEGTTLTFYGVIRDPGSQSEAGFSTMNSVVLRIE